jgi:hypothetical protein
MVPLQGEVMKKRSGFFPITFALLFAWIGAFAQSDGVLTVKTQPEGIKVWIDDKYIGDSPILDKKLKPGRYSLKLVDPVQQTSSLEEVFIQAGETTVIEKTVKSNYGSLKVTTDPEGADVFILTGLGKTPVSNDFMIPGKYRLEIKHPSASYEKVTSDIVVPRGEVVNITKTLEEKSLLNGKAVARLCLGAGALAGFVLALAERDDHNFGGDNGSVTGRALGITAGILCVVGFEIVAFF